MASGVELGGRREFSGGRREGFWMFTPPPRNEWMINFKRSYPTLCTLKKKMNCSKYN
jgi:hypothetical protein